MAVSAGKSTKVIGNIIYGDKETGIIAADKIYISNNLFEDCMFAINGGVETDSIIVINNTISSIGNIYSGFQTGIQIVNDRSPMRIENNIIAFNNGSGLTVSSSNIYTPDAFIINNNNNVFMNSNDYSSVMINPTGSNRYA